jgi:hypothetical protein
MLSEKKAGTALQEKVANYGSLLKELAVSTGAAAKGAVAEFSAKNPNAKVAEDLFLPDGAILPEVDFSGATLSRLEARGAILRSAKFHGAALNHARLYNGFLMDANFHSIQGREMRFTSCSLDRACFEDADIRSSIFESCILAGAKFRGARLEGANFNGSVLAGADLKGAQFDDSVVLPNGMRLGAFIRDSVPVILAAGGADLGRIFRASEWSNYSDRVLLLAFGERDLSRPMDDRFSAHPDCYQFHVPARVAADVVLFLQLFRAGAIPFSKVKDLAK